MEDTPILMENTKIHSFSRFNPTVYKRNIQFFRKIFKADLTPAMCESAGIAVPSWLTKADPAIEPEPAVETVPVIEPEPAVETVPVIEPEVETAPVIDLEPAAEERPDFLEWDEDKLRTFTQDRDIPTHPSAKKPGLLAAVTRYFDELAAE